MLRVDNSENSEICGHEMVVPHKELRFRTHGHRQRYEREHGNFGGGAVDTNADYSFVLVKHTSHKCEACRRRCESEGADQRHVQHSSWGLVMSQAQIQMVRTALHNQGQGQIGQIAPRGPADDSRETNAHLRTLITIDREMQQAMQAILDELREIRRANDANMNELREILTNAFERGEGGGDEMTDVTADE